MRIIIAPAKQMMEDREEPTPQGLPVFLPRAEEIIQKSVYAKMARGDMVRFMAENRPPDSESISVLSVISYFT